MKKRNILFAILLVMTMLVTACGSNSQSLEGKWVGSLDVTKQFEDGIKKAYPDLEQYVDFEELVFVLDIEFVDGQMSMSVQQESINAFNANFAAVMKDIAEGYWIAKLAEYDMTLEEESYESGMTEEEYLQYIYKQTQIDKLIEAMNQVTNETLDKLSNMEGTYTTLDTELRLWYEDETYEAMEYSLKGDDLNIIVKGDNFSLLIECEESK